MEYPKFKVCCMCFTFNQAKYITDAMNGFTMQQTSFPFVCTIVDDASTDGEQGVIKQYVDENFDWSQKGVSYTKETGYAHITYAQHKINKNCYFAVLYLKENHYSQRKPKMGYLSEWRDMCEYEALCEGDDYWVDSHKLQKQYVFLENNTDYSFCFHNAFVIETTKTSQLVKSFCNYKNDTDFTIIDAINRWSIPTASIMFKIDAGHPYPNWMAKIYSGDLSLSLILLSKAKGYYINKYMSVYNLNKCNESATAVVIKRGVSFMKSEHLKLFQSLYNMPNLTHEISKALDIKVLKLEQSYRYELHKEKRQYYKFLFSKSSFCLFLKDIKKKMVNCIIKHFG